MRGAVLRAAVAEFDFRAHGGEQLARGFDVAHLRNVFQNDRLFGEQSRSHGGQRGILGAADANRAEQRIAAANYKFIHEDGLKSAGTERFVDYCDDLILPG